MWQKNASEILNSLPSQQAGWTKKKPASGTGGFL